MRIISKSSHLLKIEVGLENKTESSIRVDLIAFELLEVDVMKDSCSVFELMEDE